MHDMVPARARALGAACVLAAGLLWSPFAGVAAAAAEDRKALLLLPVASGTPGQEWSARALGGILEDGFGSQRSVRLVAGTAREVALRELAAGATVTPEAFRDICRRAGADLAVLGGSTLVAGRLALEVKVFDVGAARELRSFGKDESLARAFNLVEAAVRHIAAEAAIGVTEPLFPRGVTVSLEAYAAYRAALLEEAPAARVEKLRGVLALDPDYADPTRRLGVELFRMGALNEALGVLERAVALGPKVAEARNNYGVALAAAGRLEPAQREFEEAVSLAPDYAEARLNLARVFDDRGRAADAEKQYAAVLEADAGNDKARAGLAAIYDRTNRPELALKEFRLLSARRPDLAEAEFVRVGQEARKAREYARAEKFFLRATDINPQFAQAWADLGTNSYLAGEYPKGVEYFRKALTIDPGQAAYHYYLALALDKGKRQDEALREYRRAVELGGPPEARLGLARAALESGDPGLAVEELNRMLVASPDSAEAKALLAQATGEMEARRRLVESQSQFANQRLVRLEQIVADANRANRELEARLQAVTQEKLVLEKQGLREYGSAPGARAEPSPDLAAEQAKTLELGRGSGEVEELRLRLAGLQAEQTRAQAESSQERELRLQEIARLKTDLTMKVSETAELKGLLLAAQAAAARAEDAQRAERERGERALDAERLERRAEVEKLRAELAAADFKKQDRSRMTQDLAAEKTQAAAAQAAREKAERALSAEREARGADIEKLKTELAAALIRKQDRDRLARDLAGEQRGREKAEQALAADRVRSEKALADERANRQSDGERLKTELAVVTARAQDRDRLAQELAAEQARARGEQAGREKAEQALAAERATRQSEAEKLKTELAAMTARAQERERLAQELAAEQARARAERAGREKAEQALADGREAAASAEVAERANSARALAAERERGERAVAAERDESRRQEALVAGRVEALEAQLKAQVQITQTREAELTAARARESSIAAQHTKAQADFALLAERQSALEARAVADARTIAERERVLEKSRLALRDLALELGRIALRTQSWEKARGYLEQAAEADPRSGEAWYGLGEALFELGQYEKSKQMYDKAKQIY